MAKEKLFTVEGFSVYRDSVYVIKDKPDMDAPTGYIVKGVSKLPSRGVGDSFQVNFKSRDNGRTGIWDTGFFEYSPCYKDMPAEEIKPVVMALKKNLVTPYKKASGIADAFDEGNDKFFADLSFNVFSGKTFNTADPLSAVELYFGLLAHQITPKSEIGNSKFEDSSYVVVDINKDLKIKDEKALDKFRAIGSFTSMLSADKNRLFAILKFAGLNFQSTVEDAVLIGMFNDHLATNNEDRVKFFNDLVEETNEEQGLHKIFIYRTLKELSVKGGKVSRTNGLFFYDGTEIGADLKSAADNVAKLQKLVHIKKELLSLEDED
jgi:hypothetical protein